MEPNIPSPRQSTAAAAVVPPPVPDWHQTAAAPADSWQSRYEREKKRSLLFAVTTAGASVLAVVALVWGIAQSPSTAATNASAGLPGATTGQFPGGGTTGQVPDGVTGQMPGGGGPGGMDPATELFNTDGSVNTAAVKRFFTMMPPGLTAETIISQMESDGAITAEQADALREAAATGTGTGTVTTSTTPNSAGNV